MKRYLLWLLLIAALVISTGAHAQYPFTGRCKVGPCPTVVKSGIATQGITTTAATLHFHSNFLVHGGFRYHETPSGGWVYRHDVDADSMQHTVTLSGLSPATAYVWQSMTRFSGCDSSAYGDSTDAITACPIVTPSAFASNEITTTGASLYFVTDYSVHGGFRYHTSPDGGWIYRHDADADSVGHMISIAGLSPALLYTWESVTQYAGCDSCAYGDSTSFTTACPTLAFSNIASQAITSGGLTMHAHVSDASDVHFRIHASPSGAWAYYGTGSDSVQATRAVTGLLPNTDYVYEMNGKYTGCDSTAFGDSTLATTLCPTVVQSGWTAYATSTTSIKIIWDTDYITAAAIRIGVAGGANVSNGPESGADSLTHYILSTSLAEGNTYAYHTKVIYSGCDSSAWSAEKLAYTPCGTQPSATWSTDPPPVCCLDETYNNANAATVATRQKMHVEYKLASEPTVWTEVVGATFGTGVQSLAIPTLTPATSYNVRFRWENPCGSYSDYSTTQTKTTDASGFFPDVCGGV